MDKLVSRVTIVRGSGENRQTDVVYKSGDDEDADLDMPRFNKLERSVRHLLKAQVIGAQEAYQRHLESVEKGGDSWLVEDPFNLIKARRKAMREARKASPFQLMSFGSDDNEDEDKED
jgi:hypothetical protein